MVLSAVSSFTLLIVINIYYIKSVSAQAYFDPTVVCVGGESTRYIRSQPVRCPCHFKAEYWGKDPTVPNITAEIYALPVGIIDEWRSKAKVSFSLHDPLPKIPADVSHGIQIRSVSLSNPINNTKYTGWSSDETFDIIDSNQYMALSFFKSYAKEGEKTCLKARVILEPIPTKCPIRLLPPPTSPQKYVTGGSVIKGDEDNIAEYNAHIINSKEQRYCTASVISNRWLLTAAHCSITPGETVVRIGARNSTVYQVKKFIPHPKFLNWNNATSGTVLNDIALVELREQIPSPHIIRLNSNMDGPFSGTIVRISGYGMTSTIKPAHNNTTQAIGFVDVTTISTADCVLKFHKADASKLAAGIRENYHICIGRDKVCPGGGICYGDSGSGLLARNADGGLVQVGIASYSVEKCASNAPDVFTRVSNYIDWIGNVTGEDTVQVTPWSAPKTDSAVAKNKIRSFWIIIVAFAAVAACVVVSILCVVRHRTRRKVEVINDPTGLTNKV